MVSRITTDMNERLSYLFPQFHNLESLKVGQRTSPVCLFGLLGVGAVGPFGVDLVLSPKLADGTSSSGERELGDRQGSEVDVREGSNVTGDNLVLLSRRAIDKNLVCAQTAHDEVCQKPFPKTRNPKGKEEKKT